MFWFDLCSSPAWSFLTMAHLSGHYYGHSLPPLYFSSHTSLKLFLLPPFGDSMNTGPLLRLAFARASSKSWTLAKKTSSFWNVVVLKIRMMASVSNISQEDHSGFQNGRSKPYSVLVHSSSNMGLLQTTVFMPRLNTTILIDECTIFQVTCWKRKKSIYSRKLKRSTEPTQYA